MRQIPNDFPRCNFVQRVLLRADALPCCPPPCEIYTVPFSDDDQAERWELCEDLARALCHLAIRDAYRRSHDEALTRIRAALRRRSWVTAAELDWVISRMRRLLGW